MFRAQGLGFLQLEVPFSGSPIIRLIIVHWGLYWGALSLGNYHIWLGVEGIVLRVLGFRLRVVATGFHGADGRSRQDFCV